MNMYFFCIKKTYIKTSKEKLKENNDLRLTSRANAGTQKLTV